MHAPYPPETLARIALALERIADAITTQPADPAPDTPAPDTPQPAAAKDDAPPSNENTMNSENRPLSLREAADYCGVSVETMRARVKDGTIPAARLGTAIRIRPVDLDALFVASPVQEARRGR